MIYYVDTSAFLAILDADDRNHISAKKKWEELILSDDALVCTDYVLLETVALIQHRIGLIALKVFHEDIFPLLTIQWIDEATYRTGITSVITAGKRDLSLVDCISFETMRRLGIRRAFAFDRHFKDQGFLLP